MRTDSHQSTKAARIEERAVPALLIALVLIGPAVYLDGTIGSDENIWAGLGLGWTAVMGVPWSLPVMFGAVPVANGILEVTLSTACALLNVLIVTLAFRRRSNRAGPAQ